MKRKLHNILFTGIIGMISVTSALAQGTTAAADAPVAKPVVPEIFFSPSFYLLAFLFLIMFVAIISLTKTIRHMSRALLPADKKKALEMKDAARAVEAANAPSFWTRFDRDVLTKAAPVEREADVMLDHNYDGIKELDNSLPPWWVWGFYITIIWGVIYLIHYHVIDTGLLSADEYKQEVATAELKIKEYHAKTADLVSVETVTLLNTPEGLGAGKETFIKNCVPCHGPGGEGTVGPNLTDEFWIHGGGIKNVFKTITDGVPAKGMISWKTQLSPKQIQEVASFVLSLQGTKPANGKAPQGDKWVEEGTTAITPADSTASTTDSTKMAATPAVK